MTSKQVVSHSSPLSTKLFRIRAVAEPKRQPRCRNVLDAIQSLLSQQGIPDTYDLRTETLNQVSQICSEPANEHLLPAQFSTSYIYRLMSFETILNYCTNVYDDTLHKQFVRQLKYYEQCNDWLELGGLVKGHLSGWQSVTWWTSNDLSNGDPATHVYRLGMARDGIHRLSAVLRCEVAKLDNLNAFVPSPVEAIRSPIFYCARESEAESGGAGTTIDISDVQNLKFGVPEYLLQDIPVELIDFYPIIMDLPIDRDHRLDASDGLWASLVSFLAQEYKKEIDGTV